MATIRRHVIPDDSFAPDKPLNDLMYVQFEHFKAVARTLPPEVQAELPPEPQIDPIAAARYVAAVTERLHLASPRGPRPVLAQEEPTGLAARRTMQMAPESEPGVPATAGRGKKNQGASGRARGKKP